MTKLAIFASGSGSNAENLIKYFDKHNKIECKLILTNNAEAGVILRGQKLNVPVVVFSRTMFSKSDEVVNILKSLEIDWVVLAGFLWLIPENLIKAFNNKIVNIHPALLPKYGGKGMWGHHVHQAVKNNNETETGITIHLVNEHYDEGKVIFQSKCEVLPNDTPETIAEKVHWLEYEHFPVVVEKLINGAN
jgi:phosphoribosylglycinamide formyltransferase-1